MSRKNKSQSTDTTPKAADVTSPPPATSLVAAGDVPIVTSPVAMIGEDIAVRGDEPVRAFTPDGKRFEFDFDYRHPNADPGAKWVHVTLVRNGNPQDLTDRLNVIRQVREGQKIDDVVVAAKAELIAWHETGIAPDNDDRPEPDATNNAGANDPPPPEQSPATPPPVTINHILGDLAAHDGRHGALFTRPEPRLSAEQARTQSQLYEALVARGVPLRRQQDVYPWLLEQVAASAKDVA